MQLCFDPFKGDRIPGFDHFWKYRIGITKLRLSKRDGFRLIYFIDEPNKGIVPAYIYFKPDKDNLTYEELDELTAELDAIIIKKSK